MDPEHRRIIKDNLILASNIDVNELKPYFRQLKIFTNAMLDDIYDPVTLLNELPTRGPDAFSLFISALEKASYIKEARNLENAALQNSKIDSSGKGFYTVTSGSNSGFCLIINNVDFKEMKPRKGSEKDATSLIKVFENFGYEIEPEDNLIAEDMFLRLKRFSEKDFSNVESCVVIILSHGGKIDESDVIYGTDSNYIKKEDILRMFNNSNCKLLKDKPKMFFFQACRTEEWVPGANNAGDCSWMDKYDRLLRDMLVVHSTLPDNVAYRIPDRGSWFCMDLVDVLSTQYLDHDLESMIKSVDEKLQSRLSKENNRQVVHSEYHTFTKKLQFLHKNLK